MTQSTVSLGKSLSKENIKAGGSMVDLTARSLDSPTHGAMVGAAEERVGKFDEVPSLSNAMFGFVSEIVCIGIPHGSRTVGAFMSS